MAHFYLQHEDFQHQARRRPLGSVQRKVPAPAALERAPADNDQSQEGDEAAPPPVPAITGQRLWTGQHTDTSPYSETGKGKQTP